MKIKYFLIKNPFQIFYVLIMLLGFVSCKKNKSDAQNPAIISDTYTVNQYSNGFINDIKCDTMGNVWFLRNNDLIKYYHQSWSYLYDTTITNSAAKFNCMEITNNKIIIGTENDGIFIYSNNSWQKIANDTTNNFLMQIKDIKVDKNKDIWVLSQKGIAKYNSSWNLIYSNDTLSFNYIWHSTPYDYFNLLGVDNANNLWFGNGGELLKYDGKIWTTNKNNNTIFSINVTTNDVIWMAHGNGLSTFSNNQFSFIPSSVPHLNDPFVYSIKQDKIGRTWFCTGGPNFSSELVKYENNNWVRYNFDNKYDELEHLAIDNDNHIWMMKGGNTIIEFIEKH